MKKIIAIALALVMVLCLAACGGNDDQTGTPSSSGADANTPYVTLKWADHNTDGCPTSVSMDALAAQIEEATEGRVKVDVYHGGVLGTGPDALSMLETGVCDMVWTSTAFFAGQFPYSEVMLLPMMGIEDSVSGTNILWDVYEAFPEVFAPEFESYHLVTAYLNPVTLLGTSGGDISSLDDLKGLNLRTAAGPDTKVAEAWGASPVSCAPPDLYLALQKGVVDGYLFAANGVATWGLSELTNCMVDLRLGYAPGFVLMSEQAWNSLTPEDQQIITELGGRTGGLMMAEYTEEEARQLAEAHIANGGTYKSLLPGDPLFEELKAPLANIVSEWVTSTTTAEFNSQELVDFIANAVAK